MEAGNIPEEYYSYLENWYRSQVTAHLTDSKTGSAPALHTALSSPFSLQQVPSSSSSSVSSPVFIPVSALQSLRASLPAELPKISGGNQCSVLLSHWSSEALVGLEIQSDSLASNLVP